MKTRCLTALLLLPLSLLLQTGCAALQPGKAPADTGQQQARKQQASAERLADEYLDCTDRIDEKTAMESYANPAIRRDVVMESCREQETRFTIVQEQAYSNACLAAGKEAGSCDREAVTRARRDMADLQERARRQIDQTSAAARRYLRP